MTPVHTTPQAMSELIPLLIFATEVFVIATASVALALVYANRRCR